MNDFYCPAKVEIWMRVQHFDKRLLPFKKTPRLRERKVYPNNSGQRVWCFILLVPIVCEHLEAICPFELLYLTKCLCTIFFPAKGSRSTIEIEWSFLLRKAKAHIRHVTIFPLQKKEPLLFKKELYFYKFLGTKTLESQKYTWSELCSSLLLGRSSARAAYIYIDFL